MRQGVAQRPRCAAWRHGLLHRDHAKGEFQEGFGSFVVHLHLMRQEQHDVAALVVMTALACGGNGSGDDVGPPHRGARAPMLTSQNCRGDGDAT